MHASSCLNDETFLTTGKCEPFPLKNSSQDIKSRGDAMGEVPTGLSIHCGHVCDPKIELRLSELSFLNYGDDYLDCWEQRSVNSITIICGVSHLSNT